MLCESCERYPARFWAAFGQGRELRKAPGFAVCGDCLTAVDPNQHDWVEIIKLPA